METNCLVTKLKAAVNNPNLPYFDSYEFELKKRTSSGSGNNNLRITYDNVDNIWLEIIDPTGNAYFTDSSYTENLGQVYKDNVDVVANPKIINNNDSPVKILIRNAKNVTKLFEFQVDTALSSKHYVLNTLYDSLEELTFFNAYIDIDISKLVNIQLTRLCLRQGSKLFGNISDLPATLQEVKIEECGTFFTGMIGNAPFVDADTIGIRFNTMIIGNLEDFLEKCCLQRTSTNAMSFTGNSSGIKFNNEGLSSGAYSITFSGGGCTVAKSGQTIGSYDGSTWTYA